MDLTSEQLAAATAAGCAFFPATEAQVQRLTMQRRIFRLDGKPFMVTRDGGFYETHGTLLKLIESYRHLAADTATAPSVQQSRPDVATPIAATPSSAEPQEQVTAPVLDSNSFTLGVQGAANGGHASMPEAAGAKPPNTAGSRSGGHPTQEAGTVGASAVPALVEAKASGNQGTVAEETAPRKDTGPSVAKRRRVRQSDGLLLDRPAQTPPDVSDASRSASFSLAETRQDLLPQISSNASVIAEPETPEAVTEAIEKAVRGARSRPQATRNGAREAKVAPSEPQPELPFSEPATPDTEAPEATDDASEAEPSPPRAGRPRAVRRRAGQPKTPRWMTAGAVRRGRLK